MKRHSTYNRIALLVTVLFVAFMGWFGLRGLFYNTLALEQEVRCGIPAHTHSAACYDGHRRVCGQEEHSHSRNCYIVLLEDNDINDLLVQMSARVDNSLEGVIGQTVDNALVYNTNLTSPLSGGTTLADVAALNSTVEENNVTPAVVFNENIQTRVSSSDTLGATLPTGSSSGGVSTLALGGESTNDTRKANYYVLLDNEWTLVGTTDFSTVRQSSRKYHARVALNAVLTLYNNKLESNFTSNDVSFTVSHSYDAVSWTNTYTASESRTTYLYFQASSSNYYGSEANAALAKYVRLYDKNNQPIRFSTVTLQYSDGTTTTQYVRNGTSFTLPEGSDWTDGNEEYTGGTAVPINGPVIFTVPESDGSLVINYDVNFPDSISGVDMTSSNLNPGLPTLVGLPYTEHREKIPFESSTQLLSVTYPTVKAPLSGSTTGQHRVIRFVGWRTQDGQLLSGNTQLKWPELSALVSGKTLYLTGVWEYNALQTVSFFVRYDSVAVDINGNVSGNAAVDYTDEVFSTFVKGVDTSKSTETLQSLYGIADSTSDNSYTADQQIRALYGKTEEGKISLIDFPKDEDIFKLLEPYANTGNLKVATSTGTEVISTSQLNTNYCSIRWYVFKSQGDAWHVDGRLVKKEGILDITKTFAGNAEAIASAKEHFSITARHNVTNGVQYTLTLAQNDPHLLKVSADGNTYHWRIPGLTYGQQWVITEDTERDGDDTYIVHSDWRVVDTYGSWNGDVFIDQDGNGTGTEVGADPDNPLTITTVATDMDEYFPLTVNFTNIYHNSDSIIIKKEDSRTGNPLGGAVFQLLQNGEPMKFVYDSTANIFRYYDTVPDGTAYVTELSGSASGYYELNIHGFEYSNGNIVVQEVKAPDGYTPIGEIIIGYETDDDDNGNTGTASLMYAAKPPGDSNMPPGDDTGQSDGTDTQQGDGTDTQQGDGTDTQQGDGTDTQQGDGTDTQQGDGTDTQQGDGTDTQQGDGTDTQQGEGTDTQQGEGERVLMKSTGPGLNDASAVDETATEERPIVMLSDSPMAEYRNGLLIIRNSADDTSVTVYKQWKCLPDNRRPVTMQLFANGAPVTALLSTVPLTQVLSAENNWTATWGNLPLFANGEKIRWDVREVKIGDENCLSDYKFVNWLVTYGPAQETTASDGRVINTSFTVTNDTYRTLLYVLKTDRGGSLRLAGAHFTLERMRNGAVDTSFAARSDITDANGMITFDALEHGDYRLTETKPPNGYDTMEAPIFLTLRTDGTVAVQDHPYAMSGNTAYTVQVLNNQLRPLPATGGPGTAAFYLMGLLLMAGAIGTAWCSRRRRGGGAP